MPSAATLPSPRQRSPAGAGPASATADTAAYVGYTGSLPLSETKEPLDVNKVMAPTSETDEPALI